MNIFKDFTLGMFSVLRVTSAPMLYRYPYRNSAEGLRSDWSRVAADIEHITTQIGRSHRG